MKTDAISPIYTILLLYSFYNPSRVLREFSKSSGRTLEELSKKLGKKGELSQNQYRRNIEEMTNCLFAISVLIVK
jgi:hypothetical protein